MTALAPTEEVDDQAYADTLDMRSFARSRLERVSTGDQLYRLYLLVLLTAPGAYLLVVALGDTPRVGEAAVGSLIGRTAVVVPVVLLGLAISAVRLAAWTGPVVVARADISWLFSLPFPRERLIRPRLRRAMIVAAVVGALCGALATIPYHLAVGPAPDFASEAGRMAVAAAVGGALYALILAAVGWIVEGRPRLARVAMRWGGLALVLLAAIAAYGLLGPPLPEWVQTVAMASGPWGWLTAAVLSATSPPGTSLLAGVAGTLALLALAGPLVVRAYGNAGDVSLRELSRRAETSAQVTAAAVYFADFRSAAQARDRVVRNLVGRSRRRLPMPKRSWLITPWIGSTVLLRQPRRLGQALLWMLGATWLLVGGLDSMIAANGGLTWRMLLIPLAGAVAYPAAGTIIEPLRVELEQRFGLRMLSPGLQRMGLEHLVAPALSLWLIGMAAAAALTAVGVITPTGLALAPVVLILAVGMLVMVAAFVASGPPADSMWLYSGDSGLGRLVAHLLRGPILAALTVGVPVLFSGDMADPAALPSALLSATFWVGAVGIGFGRWVQQRLVKFH